VESVEAWNIESLVCELSSKKNADTALTSTVDGVLPFFLCTTKSTNDITVTISLSASGDKQFLCNVRSAFG